MGQTTFGISNKILYPVLALILLAWGISGLGEIAKNPYSGYKIGPNRVVNTVRPGSPAETAGLKVGDQITKRDGIPVENSAALAERPHTVAGSTGTLTVLRGGTEQTLNIKYGEQPTANLLLNDAAGILVGLASLILGLLAYLRNPTERSSMFCLLLLGLAALFLPRPYLQSATARGYVGAFFNIIVDLWLALLLLYCLKFPETKKLLAERSWLSGMIVALALIPGVIFAYQSIVRPTISNSTQTILGLLSGIIFGGIFLCALLAILHSYLKAEASQRRTLGLNWMALGVIVGLAPIVLTILLRLLMPNMSEQPWERLTGLLFLAIPVCFTLALMKLEPVQQVTAEEATT